MVPDAFVVAMTQVISPMNLLLMLAGVVFGTVVGILPGLGAPIAITVCLPFTFYLAPIQAFGLLLGVYSAAIFGGSVTAITLNIPGTGAAFATLLDGNTMFRRGRGPEALGLALVGSVFGGLFSAVVLAFTAPVLAKFAIKFGPREYLAVTIFSVMIVGRVAEGSLVKGMLMAAVGMFLTTFGADPLNGKIRYLFGRYELYSGLPFIAVVVGIVAVSEVFMLSETLMVARPGAGERLKTVLPTLKQLFKMRGTLLRSAVIGTVIGILPGEGGAIGAFLSYSEAKRKSKNPDRFGNGEPEGVLAPEVANNATVGGALVPTLTLGIPGSPAAAILLGALLIQGLTAGPRLMREAPELMYSIFVGLFIINFMMMGVGVIAIRYSAGIVRVPSQTLVPLVMLLSFVGAFSSNNDRFSVFVMLCAGIFGYVIRKLKFPIAPFAIGFVLGPLLEKSFRQSIQISQGDVATFFGSPIALSIYGLLLFVFIWPPIRERIRGRRRVTSGRQSR